MFRFFSKLLFNNNINIYNNVFKYNINTFSNINIINITNRYIFNIKFINNKYIINNNNYILNTKRYFAGRQKGLKRHKHKHQPRRIQESLGKRLELFYPKKSKQIRIRLIQNSRNNLIYDPVLRKFYVYYFKQGTQVFKTFSINRRRNFELAKINSINFIKNFNKYYIDKYNYNIQNNPSLFKSDIQFPSQILNYNINQTINQSLNQNSNILSIQNDNFKFISGINKINKLQPDCNLSGIRNIFFDNKKKSWVVCYNEFGIRKYKFFNIDELGFNHSYISAINFLKFQLFKFNKFLIRRHRTRKGRPILKC